jgi:hypothetical protein
MCRWSCWHAKLWPPPNCLSIYEGANKYVPLDVIRERERLTIIGVAATMLANRTRMNFMLPVSLVVFFGLEGSSGEMDEIEVRAAMTVVRKEAPVSLCT